MLRPPGVVRLTSRPEGLPNGHGFPDRPNAAHKAAALTGNGAAGWRPPFCFCTNAAGARHLRATVYRGAYYALLVCGQGWDGTTDGKRCDCCMVPPGGSGFDVKPGYDAGQHLIARRAHSQDLTGDLEVPPFAPPGHVIVQPRFDDPGSQPRKLGRRADGSMAPPRGAAGCIEASPSPAAGFSPNLYEYAVLLRECKRMRRALALQAYLADQDVYDDDSGPLRYEIEGIERLNNPLPGDEFRAAEFRYAHFPPLFRFAFMNGLAVGKIVEGNAALDEPHAIDGNLMPNPTTAIPAGVVIAMRGGGATPGLDQVSIASPPGKWEPAPDAWRLAVCDVTEICFQSTAHPAPYRWCLRATPTDPSSTDANAWAQLRTPGRGHGLGISNAAILDAAMRGYVPWTTVYATAVLYTDTWAKQGLAV
mmetsp:Transcript_12230/g.37703  ORF Transcript_12230/g.37703 Transcript_12230/m.37703 type:complete len:420 (+) Transcript_12230:1080-2339(+)